MRSFTLDTNCIIDLDEGRPASPFVRQLVDAHAAGLAEVALVAVSASERQPGDRYLENYADFTGRVRALGLEELPVLKGIAYFNIGFFGMGVWADEPMVERERAIHEVLFPGFPFSWPDFAASVGVSPETIRIPAARPWRNRFCDRQMFWAHDANRRDVFVTSDANFGRLKTAAKFPGAIIATPEEAVQSL